jgi:elongation factor 1-beta
VKAFQQIKEAPPVEKYPFAYRWYKHIASFESDFSKLPGDPSKEATAYGPGSEELTLNPAKAPEKEEEDDDEENEKLKAARVEEYKKKKEGKVKPAAKSIVTLDVKPWGKSCQFSSCDENTH